MTGNLNNEYRRLLESNRVGRLTADDDVVRRYIAAFEESYMSRNQAVTIYDNFSLEHVYVSEYHRQLFGSGEMKVHPDDLDDVMKHAIATLKHFFQGNRNLEHIKIVREYRAN